MQISNLGWFESCAFPSNSITFGHGCNFINSIESTDLKTASELLWLDVCLDTSDRSLTTHIDPPSYQVSTAHAVIVTMLHLHSNNSTPNSRYTQWETMQVNSLYWLELKFALVSSRLRRRQARSHRRGFDKGGQISCLCLTDRERICSGRHAFLCARPRHSSLNNDKTTRKSSKCQKVMTCYLNQLAALERTASRPYRAETVQPLSSDGRNVDVQHLQPTGMGVPPL